MTAEKSLTSYLKRWTSFFVLQQIPAGLLREKQNSEQPVIQRTNE
jgi:hypothetical protein